MEFSTVQGVIDALKQLGYEAELIVTVAKDFSFYEVLRQINQRLAAEMAGPIAAHVQPDEINRTIVLVRYENKNSR